MISTRKTTLICLSYFLLSTAVFAQTTGDKIQHSFQRFLTQETMNHGIAAIHVVNSKTGDLVYEHNSQLGLPTASTLKVITAITALDLLGADYRYETRLGYSGVIDPSGILHGDLIILGSGDPTLGSDRYDETKSTALLAQWIGAIRAQGIHAIQGRIIADDRLYSGHTVPDGWPWVDMGNYYGAGVSALNWKENKAGVNFQPGAIGAATPLGNMTVDLSYLKVVNLVSTGSKGSGDAVYAYSAPYSDKIYLRGTYGQDLKKTIEISIPDPAFQLAHDLQQALQKAEIIVGSAPTTGQLLVEDGQSVPTISNTILTHQSPKLSDIVHWFNQKSINLYGEALLQRIARLDGNFSTAEGAAAIKKHWKQKLQISAAELDIHDGSGLSPQNNVTARAMNRIMQYAIAKPWYGDFVKSLPTINRMTMKSGTISGTLGYTGYHTSANGVPYTFAILVYNYIGSASAMRNKMFGVLDNLR